MSNIRAIIMQIMWHTMDYFAAAYNDGFEGNVKPL